MENNNSSVAAEAHPGRLTEPVDGESPPRLPFPVVGIGASAGGLEAFLEFFRVMPSDSGMAFILVQHLPPDRESMIAEILARRCTMPVLQVEDGMKIESNHVYIIRPGRNLTIADGTLHLGEPVEKPGHRRPVDVFFRSLAAEQRERAVAVIMSGMGSNGTAGAQAIKAVGGICIAQDPGTAKFPGMPRNLIDAGYADFVLRLAEMPELLIRYGRHPYTRGAREQDLDQARERQVLSEVVAVLRARLKLDFSGYKKPTLLRRVQRRMGLNQIATFGDYARLLRQNPAEVAALADDVMIHVTGFFRDPEVWEALRQKVIVPLVTERAADTSLRAWVTACSSGEEAYTLGMLLVEAAEAAGKHFDVKIFATDTAARSLSHARVGIYPGGIESEISPERLERFFERDDAVYRVKKFLRELVVFAPQNLLQDPPFSRLDLCTCRNLLIYLEPDVQQRALALMHFGLREGGALLLGTSETITDVGSMYETIDKKHRIFRRIGPTRYGAIDFPLPQGLLAGSEQDNVRHVLPKATLAQLTQRLLLENYAPPAVVVDRQQQVVYFQGRTEKYLDLPQGEPTRDLLALAKESVRGILRLALQKAIAENAAVTMQGGLLEGSAARHRIEVVITPLEFRLAPFYFIVSFVERPNVPADPPLLSDAPSATASRDLQNELQRTRDELQSTIEELQTSNEEMKASNEETTSINEELQSTNEELETSKEELQSLNEELTTVNAQLQNKMEELEGTTNDLSSLLSSTNIAVIFLDTRLRIRRFTPAVKDLLQLIPADIGRPLNDLAKKFRDDHLLRDTQQVLESLVPRESEIVSESGRLYMRRVLPYRTMDNRIEGVVITFIDIGARRQAEDDLRRSEQRHRLILDAIHEYAIFMLDAAARILTWTPAAEQITGYSAEEAIGQPFALIFTPEERAAGAPEKKLQLAARDGQVAEEHWHIRKDGSRFWGSGTLYVLREDGQNVTGYVKVLRDNSDRRVAEDALIQAKRSAEEANEAKDQFLANVSHELRTPLSGMLLWTKLLVEGEAPSPAQLQEGLQAIRKCAEEQQALIEDLVDTSRIAAGKLRLERHDTALAPLVHSALATIMPVARGKDIRVEEKIDPAVGLVSADPHRLHQVIWNLLTNAVKFTPSGGAISVRMRREGDTVEIEVEDTGIGMEADFISRIFERFHQAEDATTRAHNGLGLGLAITRQLVELHDGTITARSEGRGRGAVFTVRLPLPAVDPSGPGRKDGASPAERTDLSGLRVLFVEDMPETRRAVAHLLQDSGAAVSAVGDAAAALAEFKRERPDVLVSDLGLPETDGHELIRQVRRFEQEAGSPPVPAFALTAYADERNRRKALASGFQKCFTKPLDPLQLKRALARFRRPG